MLRIETCGSWYDMGHECGSTFREQILRGMDTYTPGLREGTLSPSPVQSVAAMLKDYAPELREETAGLADALDLPELTTLYYRIFPSARFLDVGCSAFFIADAEEGPLLGHTTDLNPRDAPVQVCWVRRPRQGADRITTSYVGLIPGRGMNEHGLGVQGTSAHTAERYGAAGVVSLVLAHRVLSDCRSLAEARELILKQPVLGKGAVRLVADAEGHSSLFEIAHGRLLPVGFQRWTRNAPPPR